MTRKEQHTIPAHREEFTSEDLAKLAELHPPNIMPNGNVGTQTKIFLQLIQACKLPPVVIKKLGLSFPKTRGNKKYGNVPFDYGLEVYDGPSLEEEIVKNASGKELETENTFISEGQTVKESECVNDKPSDKYSETKRKKKRTKILSCSKKKEEDIEEEEPQHSDSVSMICQTLAWLAHTSKNGMPKSHKIIPFLSAK